MRQIVCCVMAASVLMATAAKADVVERDRDGTITYVTAGKLSMAARDVRFVLDSTTGIATLILPQQRAYASGTANDFCQVTAELRAAAGGEVPDGQGQGAFVPLQTGDRPLRIVPTVSVETAGDGGRIAGLATTKYRVLADGLLSLEVWLAREPGLLRELAQFDFDALEAFEDCDAGPSSMDGAVAAEKSDHYRDLRASAWLMRKVIYVEGTKRTVAEVQDVRQAKVSSGEFKPPADYQSIGLREALHTLAGTLE